MLYQEIISVEHLFEAWQEFKAGKRNKKDVQFFERNLEENLFILHEKLINKTYQHASYTAFNIYDPKFRHIHKATVSDRVVHHAVASVLEPVFDKTFIYDSYSCRKEKGTHKAVKRLFFFIRKVSKNYNESCFCLKLDIKKFFASVDHKILLKLLKNKVEDPDIFWLLKQIIDSFHSDYGEDRGITLGNLTSQVFANIYLNELDQFIKHRLKIKYYLRYVDDFLMLEKGKVSLEEYLEPIRLFLSKELKIELHPKKIIFRKSTWGIDFLGYVSLPHYRVPRTKITRRIFKQVNTKVDLSNFNQSLQSYLGYFTHANSYKLTKKLRNEIWFLLEKDLTL